MYYAFTFIYAFVLGIFFSDSAGEVKDKDYWTEVLLVLVWPVSIPVCKIYFYLREKRRQRRVQP